VPARARDVADHVLVGDGDQRQRVEPAAVVAQSGEHLVSGGSPASAARRNAAVVTAAIASTSLGVSRRITTPVSIQHPLGPPADHGRVDAGSDRVAYLDDLWPDLPTRRSTRAGKQPINDTAGPARARLLRFRATGSERS
jgi:hypothetical protein